MAAALPLLGARAPVAPFGRPFMHSSRPNLCCCRSNAIDKQQVPKSGYGGWEEGSWQQMPSSKDDDEKWRRAMAMVACISLLGGILSGGGMRLAWGIVAGSLGTAAAIRGGLHSFVINLDMALEKMRQKHIRPDQEQIRICIVELEKLSNRGGFPSDEMKQMEESLKALKSLLRLETVVAKDTDTNTVAVQDTSSNTEVTSEPVKDISIGLDTVTATSDPYTDKNTVVVPDTDEATGPGEPAKNVVVEQEISENVPTREAADKGIEGRVKQSLTREEVKPVSEDGFTRRLKQAEELMLEGQQMEPENGNVLLERACELVEEATRMRPRNLVAVGMQANALLVHGELKLKAAERLREMLSTIKTRQTWLDMRNKLESLQQISDGCEELLLEAGRKYRKALTLRRDDVRALHNWGLALRLRARFISLEQDEGAAEDADKVYLAAIDKFEALAGMSSQPEATAAAILNWAMAVRDRSRLRTRDSNERINLLVQAKELLRDASRLSKEKQVDLELESCEMELEELETYQQLKRMR